MANGESANERATVTLRVTSPCEHGIEHEFRELTEGMCFGTKKCVDAKGNPRNHVVTAEKYPKTIRRR